jgi:hypothetical protein
MDIIMGQLDEQAVTQMSQQLGADEQQTRQAVEVSLPAIVAGLARNASKQGGADALLAALDRDHDGNIMDDLQGYLGSMMRGTQQAQNVPAAQHESAQAGGGLGGFFKQLQDQQPETVPAVTSPAARHSVGNSATAKTVDGAGILRHTLGNKRTVIEDAVGQSSGLGKEKSGRLLEMLAPIIMGSLGKTRREGNLDAGGLSDLLAQSRRAIADKDQQQGQSLDILTSLLDADGDGNIMDDLPGLLARFMRR